MSGQLCIIFDVKDSKPKYTGITDGKTTYVSVRCVTDLIVAVEDDSHTYNTTVNLVQSATTLPPGTTQTRMSGGVLKVTFTAPRGTEGKTYPVCFQGGDS